MGWLKSFILVTVIASNVFGFSREKIKLGNHVIKVEVARTSGEHARGLMNRTELGLDEGMLFVFSDQSPRTFWMKNTLIDLSIGFFDKNKTLVDIQEMQKMGSIIEQNIPTYTSARPAMYALEMNKNWFKKNKIKPGDRFEFIKSGPLSRQ